MSEGAPSNPSPIAVTPSTLPRTGLTPQQMAELGSHLKELALDPAVQETFRKIGQGIQRMFAALRPIAAVIGSTLIGLAQVLERLPEHLQKAVLALAVRGWFFDNEAFLSDYWKAEQLIAKGEFEAADALMSDHFAARLDEIEAALCDRLPERASKFRNAFAAHRRGEFDLSILAFLAQADGVCKQLRGGHFFLTDRDTRQPEAAPYAAANSDTALNQILHMALIERIPLKHQLDKRKASDRGLLNRHAVMHGESLDYDTKVNSLRALSLLNYVALTLDERDVEPAPKTVNDLLRTVASSAQPIVTRPAKE